MAEGFANRYGSDVLTCASAGLAPAPIVQPLTRKVMEQKNINIDEMTAKSVAAVDLSSFDVLVNMSGRSVPVRSSLELREWKVEDPIGKEESVYITVRDQIEMLVMQLILELRRKKDPPKAPEVNKRSQLKHSESKASTK
jgi:arsenate reductase (thioredoxin)